MKRLFQLIPFFLIQYSFGQDLQVDLIKSKEVEKDTFIYKLKIFNHTGIPIAIKTSITFRKFSEHDTLKIAIGNWSYSNGKDYYYGLDYSLSDSKFSEVLPYYNLLILNPETYLLTNIDFSDLEKYKNKNVFFEIFYTTKLTSEEYKKYTNRVNGLAEASKEERNFESKIIQIK